MYSCLFFWGRLFFFFSYFVCVFVCVKFLQSCPTLCNPMDCSPSGSSLHGILQARTLEWVAMPSSRGSSQPRDRMSPAMAGRFFISRVTWEVISSLYIWSVRYLSFACVANIFPNLLSVSWLCLMVVVCAYEVYFTWRRFLYVFMTCHHAESSAARGHQGACWCPFLVKCFSY